MKKTLIFLICIAILSLSSCTGGKAPAIQPEASGIRTTEAAQESGISAKTVVTKSGEDSTLPDKTTAKVDAPTKKATAKPTSKTTKTTKKPKTTVPTWSQICDGYGGADFLNLEQYKQVAKKVLTVGPKTYVCYPRFLEGRQIVGQISSKRVEFGVGDYNDEWPLKVNSMWTMIYMQPFEKENFEADLNKLENLFTEYSGDIVYATDRKTGARYGYFIKHYTNLAATCVVTWNNGHYVCAEVNQSLTQEQIEWILPNLAPVKVNI